MTVSQRSLFVAPAILVGTGVEVPQIWLQNDTTISVAGPPVPNGRSITGSATLPGSLVYALPGNPSGPLFDTDPTNGGSLLLAAPALATTAGPAFLTSVGSLVLFNAQDTSGRYDLWRTDGTTAGTTILSVPGAAGGLDPLNITSFNGGAVFTGSGADGRQDLYFTDGTTAGTRELAAFPSAELEPYFAPIGTVGGRLLFVGAGADGGSALWSTDGTAAGTSPYATIPALPPNPGSIITPAVEVGGRAFFEDDTSLYVTDGTAAGTTLVTDLGPASGIEGGYSTSHSFSELAAAGGLVYFSTSDAYGLNVPYGDLEVTNSTFTGATSIFPNFDIGNISDGYTAPYDLTPFGNSLLFAGIDLTSAYPGHTEGLWITDGTQASTQEIAVGIEPGDITILEDGTALVAGYANLYATDGTTAGTVDIGPGLKPSDITVLANGTAEFAGLQGLYVTDGTTAGTRLIQAIATSFGPVQSILPLPSPLTFTGNVAQYDLAPTAAGALQAHDLVAGRDGSVTIPDAQSLRFADGNQVFDPSGNAADIARIYLAAYDRSPDQNGLLTYLGQLDAGTVSLVQIAAAAPASLQFISAYGTLTDAQFVTQLYENADGRAPDPGGLAAYTRALASGQTRGQVLLAIAEGPEARMHLQGVAGDGTNAVVTRLYEAIDARAPDASGGIGYASALDGGQSVAEIAANMLAGPEYAVKFGSPSNAAFVTEIYRNLLGRAPDPGGLAAYTTALNGEESRAQLLAGFANSDEARLVTAPLAHDGYSFVH